jgi:Fe-S-cluster containining protein/tetratricopeptide (TPR) repeat protein
VNKKNNSELFTEEEISAFSEMTYDESLLTAEKALQNHLRREAFYYFEEALIEARKEGDKTKETYALTRIGEVFDLSGSYSDARTFCNLIYQNRSLRINFSCHSAGSCCKDFKINVNTLDILRILKNRPELKPQDFFILPGNSFMEKYLAGESEKEVQNGNKALFYLKKQDDQNACIFLKNNLCSIHEFKPTICKNWPMFIAADDHIRYDHIEYMKDNCHYCVEPVDSNEVLIKDSLRLQKSNKAADALLAEKLYAKLAKTKTRLDRTEIINFLLDNKANEEKYIEQIVEIIKGAPSVLKIISFYSSKTEKRENLQFGVFTSGDLVSILSNLSNSLNILKPEYLFSDNNNLITLKITDFTFNINLYNESELLKTAPSTQKILYENSNYIFPDPAPVISIHFDSRLYTLAIKALETVIKGCLKRERNSEAADYMRKLESVSQELEGDSANNELISLLTKVYLNIEEFVLLDLNKTVQSSLQQYLEKLDMALESPGIYYFDFLLKKLRLLHFLKEEENEEKLLEQIILIATNNEKYIRKLIKILKKLGRNYSESVKNKLCSFLTGLYSEELNKHNYSAVIVYIKLFHEFYDNSLSTDFGILYKYSFVELGKAFLKTKNKAKADKTFGNLLQSINEPSESFEILFSIADEYLDEGFNEEAILYFEQALQFCDENLFLENFLILDTIIDLYISDKNFQKAESNINALLGLAESFNMGENEISIKKMQALLKQEKLKFIMTSFSPENPLAVLEKHFPGPDFNLFLAQFFIDRLKTKIITLPLKLDNLYYKFSGSETELFNFIGTDQSILTLIKTLEELLIINLEMSYFEAIFRQDKVLVDLFLKARLFAELTDYPKAVENFEKVITLYSSLENNESQVLSLLKTYLAYLYQCENKIIIANQRYQEIYRESKNKKIKNIFELSIFHLRFIEQANKYNAGFLKNLFRFIAEMKASLFN